MTMNAAEQAEIWNRAAEIVAGMDTITAECNAALAAGMGNYMSRSYGPEEAAANRAYQCAARVLYTIAAGYADKAKQAAQSDEAHSDG
jgi:hypothetical protein